MPKIKKSTSFCKRNIDKYTLVTLLLPSICHAIESGTAISIPFLNDLWATLTQNVLPIIFGIGIIGAFIADRHDSETGKRVLLGIAVLAVAVKVSIAFLTWVRTAFTGL